MKSHAFWLQAIRNFMHSGVAFACSMAGRLLSKLLNQEEPVECAATRKQQHLP